MTNAPQTPAPQTPAPMRVVALRIPGGSLPLWVAELAARLAQLPGVDLRVWAVPVSAPWAHGPQAPALLRPGPPLALQPWLQAAHEPQVADVLIDLCPQLPLRGLSPPGRVKGGFRSAQREGAALSMPRWVPVDGQGRQLAARWPGVAHLAQGQGAQLTLLCQAPGQPGWQRLHQVCGSASAHYRHGVDGLFEALYRLLEQALQRWADAGCADAPDRGTHPAEPLPALGGPAVLAALWRGHWRAALRSTRERWLTEHWRVGVIDAPIHTLLERPGLPRVRWLAQRDASGYWADPFGMPGEPTQLFCERYDASTGLGHIELLQTLGNDLVTLARVPLQGPGHASFPNVFEHDGRLYGMAETGDRRECVLHEVSADGRWAPLACLISGVAVADPAIFHWQGRFWLAFSDADREPWANLCLYHADHLLGPWQPHAHNPVLLDLRGARMAGNFFWHGGQLYRPGQDGSAGYGSALALYRVEQCTPQTYRETLVCRLAPQPDGPCPDGLHTLNAWGQRTLVDGKAWHFSWRAVWHKARRRVLGASPAPQGMETQ